MTEQLSDTQSTTAEPETGYAPVNGLQMYYEIHGDLVGVPASQLAVFPGTTHFFGMARTALVLDVVTTFLDAPEAAG